MIHNTNKEKVERDLSLRYLNSYLWSIALVFDFLLSIGRAAFILKIYLFLASQFCLALKNS